MYEELEKVALPDSYFCAGRMYGTATHIGGGAGDEADGLEADYGVV